VATSALHSKQYFSTLPGSSYNPFGRPQTQHDKFDGSSLPLGPHDMTCLLETRSTRCATHREAG
jgi:hypothetical protein